MAKMIKIDDLVKAGLTINEANELHRLILQGLACDTSNRDPSSTWRYLVGQRALKPWYSHGVHQLVCNSVYADWDVSVLGPPIYWFPSLEESKNTNLGRLMEKYGSKLLGPLYQDPISSFSLFHKFSVQHPEAYWSIALNELSVSFREEPKCILDKNDESKRGGSWLPGSVLNIAECCLFPNEYPMKKDDGLAIVWRDEGSDDMRVNGLTLKQLREQVMIVANAIDSMFSKGDAIAIDMPMTTKAVVIYLAIILSGLVVVSIADSFAGKEISSRLRVSKAKAVFTQVQDVID